MDVSGTRTSGSDAKRSPDQEHYHKETHYFSDPGFIGRHRILMDAYMSTWRDRLAAHAIRKGGIRTLELGAGTCTLSLTLSQEPWIRSMHCSDISAVRMRALVGDVAKAVGGRLDRLSFSEGDFTDPLDFADGAFDVVLFDSALHHSRNMWQTLRECHRILVDGGLMIAQREAYLGRLTYGPVLHRNLRSTQVRDGVAENAYLKEQYDYYLRATGFKPTFIPAAPGRFKMISFLNGLIQSKWTIFAERQRMAPFIE